MDRLGASGDKHNSMIIKQIKTYREKGYTDIKASHIRFNGGAPEEVNGHIPDISAVFNGAQIICEVETEDSVKLKETIEQWEAFSNSQYKFDICVPRTSLKEAKQISKANQIKVNKFWWKK